jgi:acylphosphatase
MVISGRVQGVGFRYFTRRAATRLGLIGWVKNLPGGDVEVRVTGAPPALEALRQQLRQGPAGSRVDEICESDLATADWTGFEIVF